MLRKLWIFSSVLLFVLGAGSLALTLYAWFGAWPREMKEVADHYRSLAENSGRPPEPLVVNVRAREPISLGGEWQAVIDPYDRGGLAGLAPRAVHPKEPAELGEFSFENGLVLQVPGDWNTQDQRLVFYQGVVWYKRVFEYRPRADRRSFLWIGAANYRASVFVNGELVGEHEGGFTPFNFEIGDRLRDGANLLVVKVDSRHGHDDIPTPTTDWMNYGGLTREVFLVELPPVFVRAWDLHLDPATGERIRGWVQLDGLDGPEGAAESARVRVVIEELGVDVELETDASGRALLDIAASPRRWTPDAPKLYRVALSSGDDRVTDDIGFRTIETRGREILLNGEPIFLRGVSMHEESPEGGRANSAVHAEELLGWVKALNGNFVRLAHYTHNEHTLRAADRMGILVWAEIPVYWEIDWENPVTLERGRRQLSEMIERDRARASVILWSIGNETPMGEARQHFMGELAAHVKRTDPTRLSAAAVLTGAELLTPFLVRYYAPALLGWSPETWHFVADDPIAELVDVPALNEYFGWYYSGAVGLVTPFSSAHARRTMLENMTRIRLDVGVEKPVIVSEFGAGAKAGLRADPESLTAYSEDLQARVYQEQIAMLERQEGIAGVSPWVLKDFRSPLRLYQGVQDYWNRKGLVASTGERKLAFDVLREWYAERALADAR